MDVGPGPGPTSQPLGERCRQHVAMTELHVGDIYVPIDPEALTARLDAAGFVGVLVERIEAGGYAGFRFHAEAPR